MKKTVLPWFLSFALFSSFAGIASADEKLAFPSADFADKYQMALGKGKPAEVFGYLTLPTVPVEGKIPVVVIAHGSGGISPHHRDFWAPYFNHLGFAAFVVDSFTPRGVARTVEDQTLVSRAANTVDAFYALKFLAADPRFDANKIGIIGFSRGGNASAETATRTFRDHVLPENKNLQFAFHIPMYPGCQDGRYRKNHSFDKTGAPMLFLLGGKDNYTPAEQCIGMIKELQIEYPKVIEYRVYDGANHGFDGNYGVKYAGMGVTSRDCAVLEIDLETWSKHILATGESLGGAKEREFYKNCVTRGVSYGAYNSKYREMATHDIEAFLTEMKIIH
jgi:dienelactone hydrolase